MTDKNGKGGARRTDPWTSHAAARLSRSPLRRAVLAVYRDAGDDGCTIDELCVALDTRSPMSISPRPNELLRLELIEDTEETRLTRFGTRAQVRRITPAGVAALDEIAALSF